MPLLWLYHSDETFQSYKPFSGIHPKDKIDIINKNQDRKMAPRLFGIASRTLAEVIEKEILFPVRILWWERFD
jgi:hypothetical protein